MISFPVRKLELDQMERNPGQVPANIDSRDMCLVRPLTSDACYGLVESAVFVEEIA